jgi:hypothetical protein
MRPTESKKVENVAEYILYLFQIEDLVRSLNLDMERIKSQVLEPAIRDEFQLQEQISWYQNMVREMKVKGIEKEGHIDEVQEILVELTYLHNSLLTVMNDEKYKTLCGNAQEALVEFKQKSTMGQRQDVEVLMHAMFMKLQLKMRQKEISAETEEAFDLMRIQLAYLAREYQRMKSGDWDYLNN